MMLTRQDFIDSADDAATERTDRFLCTAGHGFSWLVLLAGVVMLFFGGRNLYWAMTSVHWPEADGVVVASSAIRLSKGGGDQKWDNRHWRNYVDYEFTVDGTAYDGSRLDFGTTGFGLSPRLRNLVANYPVGKDVVVHYRPGHPSTCVLRPGLTFLTWVIPGLGLLSFLFGLFLVLSILDTAKADLA